jgi:hypothetical protein
MVESVLMIGVTMNVDWFDAMLDEMLDETKWESVVDCKDCGHVPAHSPLCEVGA